MLRKRVITVLTFNDGVLFRTKEFIPDYRYTVNFVDAWSIDEIVILDITRPGQGTRGNFFDVIENFSEKCFVPIAAGGGVKHIDDFKTLLNLGADKIVINTSAIENPELLSKAAELYGNQCIVVSIDAKQKGSAYEVYSNCGSKATGLQPFDWARRVEELGAGEIMITSIDKDGSLEGYDNVLNCLVASAVSIPVLVCGGAGQWQHFVDGFKLGGASAVCTTQIFHFSETSIKTAKQYLTKKGILVRI